MLRAAESILEREGIGGLTLRAAARKAGGSHAAPKNHFGDLMGLLSELAALASRDFGPRWKHVFARAIGLCPVGSNRTRLCHQSARSE